MLGEPGYNGVIYCVKIMDDMGHSMRRCYTIKPVYHDIMELVREFAERYSSNNVFVTIHEVPVKVEVNK